jgi:hypothetical protein
MRTKNIKAFKTSPFIKKYIIKRFGEVPFVELNDILGAEIVQANLDYEYRHQKMQTTLEIGLSDRLNSLNRPIFEPLFTRLFFAQLVSFVDGQRLAEITIKQAVCNYLEYCGLSEDDLTLKAALKIYDRYRKQ